MADLASDENLLRGGDPCKKSIAIFYDSRVGTHSEYLSILKVRQVFSRLADYEVVLLDIANASDDDKSSAILSQLSIDLAKVERKTNPSVFVQVNDSLHKVKPGSLIEVTEFRRQVDKVSRVKLAASVSDLITALKTNNTELDSLTVMYCPDGDPKKSALEQKALQLLTHETQHQILEVRDPEVAKFVKMEPGKFYCYYRPSYVNGFPSDPSGNPM